jgi:hypothetical protein
MKTFVLLVTWIVSGQPPSSYQTTFNSAEVCETVRDAVLTDGQRTRRTIISGSSTGLSQSASNPMLCS